MLLRQSATFLYAATVGDYTSQFLGMKRAEPLRAVTIVLALTAVAALPGAAVEDHRVLVLHSYGLDFRWTLDMDAAIREVLENHAGGDVTVHSETLDAKYHQSDRYLAEARDFLNRKYAGWSFSAIIATDNLALKFLRAYRDELWPQTPVIFAGINDYSPELTAGMDRITGVAERLSIRKTLEEMQRLFPQRNNLHLLGEQSATGRRNLRLATRRLQDSPLNVTVHAHTSAETLEILARNLGSNDIALLVGLVMDGSSQLMDYRRSGAVTADTLPVPVFSLWDFYMDSGIVGGYMTSGRAQGRRAAELAQRVLNGEHADALPVVTANVNVPVFDRAALRPYGISLDVLPADAVIYNAPETVWERYRIQILFTVAAFLLLLSLVLIIYEIARRRGRTARETAASLRDKETLLREIHHRVKNNLQVISSMLSLQSNLVGDEKSLAYFEDARTRIQSMALVHEHLYESPSLAQIQIRDYLEELVATVTHSMDSAPEGLHVRTRVADIAVDLDRAIPLGMMVNELLSNALKYAYPEGRGEIRVDLKATEQTIYLEIADDGVGIPPEKLYENSSLGLQLVEALSDQLDGSLRFENAAPGLRVYFSFPRPDIAASV